MFVVRMRKACRGRDVARRQQAIPPTKVLRRPPIHFLPPPHLLPHQRCHLPLPLRVVPLSATSKAKRNSRAVIKVNKWNSHLHTFICICINAILIFPKILRPSWAPLRLCLRQNRYACSAATPPTCWIWAGRRATTFCSLPAWIVPQSCGIWRATSVCAPFSISTLLPV